MFKGERRGKKQRATAVAVIPAGHGFIPRVATQSKALIYSW